MSTPKTFAFRRATDEELRIPLLKEAIIAEFDTKFAWLRGIARNDDANPELTVKDFISVALDTYAEAVRKEERERGASIVEEMMEDDEHWKPIAQRILSNTPTTH